MPNSATEFTRRQFIASSAAVVSGSPLAAMVSTATEPTVRLTASAFRAQLRTSFSAVALSQQDAHTLALELIAVDAARNAHPSLTHAQASELSFSVTFATSARAIAQDTYAISHPALGEFAALMVPTPEGTALLAVFHHLA